jgi:UDP-N-acetyl-2-amino-2-deoxyglucuronate dehydrogenase
MTLMHKDYITIGILGCGEIACEFKAFFKMIKNAKFVAATDIDIKRARKMSGKDHSYTDVNKMFENEEFDVLYIATPHYLHKEHIKLAFENDKHVFCEKPVGISIQDAREIYKLTQKYPDLKLGFNYQYRYDQNCFELVSGLKKGILGNTYYANCNVYFSRDEEYFRNSYWRGFKKYAGGGTLLTQASHILDLIIWAFGKPKSVMGKITAAKFKTFDVEDLGFGIIEFENGIFAQINSSMIVKPPMEITKALSELIVFGEYGRAKCELAVPSSLQWYGIEDFSCDISTCYKPYIAGSLEAFADWILHEKPFLNTIMESSKVLCLISALYKSSETGKEEKVERIP